MTLAELSLSGGPLYAILPAALGELWREIRDVADKDYNGHFVKNVFLFLRYGAGGSAATTMVGWG